MANQINAAKVDKQITLYQRSDHKEKFWQCRLRIKDEGGKKRYLIRLRGLGKVAPERKYVQKPFTNARIAQISPSLPLIAARFPMI
jgi:hypothetical protein